MQTPVQAMVWELWRTSRFELLLRIGALCGFVLLMRLVVNDFTEPTVQALRGTVVGLLMLTSVFSQTWLGELDNSSSGFSFRLGFVRPVTTRLLVLLPMLFTSLAASTCYLLPAFLFRVVMHSSIPLFSPALIVCVLSLCITAVSWSCPNKVSRAVGLLFLAAGVIAALLVASKNAGPESPLLLRLGDPDAFRLGVVSWVSLGVIAFSALRVTHVAVERQRHGERWRQWASGIDRDKLLATRTSTSPFPNISIAQAWYELRRFGSTVLSLSIAIPLLLVIFLTSVRFVASGWRYDALVWTAAMVLSPLLYQFAGTEGAIGLKVSQGNARLSLFDAARPMASDHLVAIKLLSVTACSVFGWVVMCLVATFHTLLVGSSQQWSELMEFLVEPVGRIRPVWWFAVVPSVTFLFFASAAMLMALGLWMSLHRKWFAIGLIALAIHGWLLIWDGKNGWVYRLTWEAYAGVLAVCILSVCVLVIHRALRLAAVKTSTLTLASCFWLVYAGSVAMFYREWSSRMPIDLSLPVLSLCASVLLVPLASFAMAPLAFASHRHR